MRGVVVGLWGPVVGGSVVGRGVLHDNDDAM